MFLDILGRYLNESDEEEVIRPDEADCFIADNTRGGYDVSCGSKFIGNFKEFDNALEVINGWMEKNQFWPNIWGVSDHGNLTLLDKDGKRVQIRI